MEWLGCWVVGVWVVGLWGVGGQINGDQLGGVPFWIHAKSQTLIDSRLIDSRCLYNLKFKTPRNQIARQFFGVKIVMGDTVQNANQVRNSRTKNVHESYAINSNLSTILNKHVEMGKSGGGAASSDGKRRKQRAALRVMDIGLVALTNLESYTWLQAHESEVVKMRTLFARKDHAPPTVACYADATFRQISSFAQLRVKDLSPSAHHAGIRAARQLSAIQGGKKKAGNEAREAITRLLEQNLPGLIEGMVAAAEQKKNESKESAITRLLEQNLSGLTASRSVAAEQQKNESKESAEREAIGGAGVGDGIVSPRRRDSVSYASVKTDSNTTGAKETPKVGEGLGNVGSDVESNAKPGSAAETDAVMAAGDRAGEVSSAPVASSDSPNPKNVAGTSPASPSGKGWGWGWGKSGKGTDEHVPQSVTTAPTSSGGDNPILNAEAVEPAVMHVAGSTGIVSTSSLASTISSFDYGEWSSDEEFDIVRSKLLVDDERDRFYIFPNDHPDSVGADGGAGGEEGKVVVNCLDVSLNRFRFLDFSDASGNINWSVRRIVALNLSANLLVSLEGIAACTHLRVLSCNDNLLTSMTPLKGCKCLRRLKISGNRLVSVSVLSDDELLDYYAKFARREGDIDIDDFHDTYEELEDDKIGGLEDGPVFSDGYSDDESVEIVRSVVPKRASQFFLGGKGVESLVPKTTGTLAGQASAKVEMEGNKNAAAGSKDFGADSKNANVGEGGDSGMDTEAQKSDEVPFNAKAQQKTGVRKPHRRISRSPNLMGLPELEYLDASDNALENLEGIRIYSRNSLKYLELRNCGIQSHHLNTLRMLPLVTLRLDDNQVDNLKHTVAVLKSIRSLEHLSLLGNPVARNEDKGTEADVNGGPKNNFGSVLKISNALHLQSVVVNARKAVHAKSKNIADENAESNSDAKDIKDAAPPKPLFGKTASNRDVILGADAKAGIDSAESNKVGAKPKSNYYSITVLDHVDTLKTFDHLAVPSILYSHLRALKAQVEGEVILADIEKHFSAEIASIEHVHANLRARHSQNENMVKQIVGEKALRLEEEMDTLMRFAREKLAEIQPDAARKMFETRLERAAIAADGSSSTDTAAVTEDGWREQQEDKLRKLPAKNIKSIRDQYSMHKVRLEEEKAEIDKETERRDQLKAIKNQELMTAGNSIIQ